MIKDLRVDSAEVIDENGVKLVFFYYVREYGNAYGLKIECLESNKNNTISTHIAFEVTPAITHSYEEAESWAKLLARNTVTPSSLLEIEIDLVG